MAMNAYKTKLSNLKANAKKANADADEAESVLEATLAKCDQIEKDNLVFLDEIERLEEGVDGADSSTSSHNMLLTDAKKKYEEDKQFKATLDVRVNHDDKRIKRLETERDQAIAKLEEVSSDLEKAEAEIIEKEAELANQEIRAEDVTLQVRDLEVRMTELGNDLRTKQITDTQTSARTSSSEKRIQELEVRFQEVCTHSEELEAKAIELEKVQLELDHDLEEIKAAHKEKNEEIRLVQTMIQDL